MSSRNCGDSATVRYSPSMSSSISSTGMAWRLQSVVRRILPEQIR